MAYRLGAFADVGLSEGLLRLALAEHESAELPRLERLWTYFRNPLRTLGAGVNAANPGKSWYRLAQEVGLPGRIVGHAGRSVTDDDRATGRREVVIENDIAWRIHTMVDFMFSKPVAILSTAADAATRARIQRMLDAVWEASGGIALLQDLALLGHVFGHVDLVVRADGIGQLHEGMSDDALDAALRTDVPIRIDAIEPRRGIAILDPADYRRVLAYVIHFRRELNQRESELRSGARAVLDRLRGIALGDSATTDAHARRRRSTRTEIISAAALHAYDDETLVTASPLTWTGGRIPVAHIQNIAQPFHYSGLGEVESLIPLQDELNTRLSDRASRVTMQSFRMFLAKGFDDTAPMAVQPGQIWTTDNPDASIQAFGGDSPTPGEETHILEIREAMDKLSGVPPLASGVVRAKIGNLTSSNALRITLMGLLSKTARKRVTYGRGIAEVSRLILAALHHSGALKTTEAERGIRLQWADPLPEDEHERTLAAEAKVRLGVPRERVLAELGYAATDQGVA
jgi:hypothetical protein